MIWVENLHFSMGFGGPKAHGTVPAKPETDRFIMSNQPKYRKIIDSKEPAFCKGYMLISRRVSKGGPMEVIVTS